MFIFTNQVKCVFSCLTDSCKFCLLKGRLCNKVWGPKTQKNWGDVLTESRVMDNDQLLSSTLNPIIPLSLLRDNTRSDLELFYLRFLHARHPPTDNTIIGIIIQNLWNVYGSNFGDDCLLYAVLSLACVDMSTSNHKIPVLLPNEEESRYHYCLFKAKFHTGLRLALAENKISECHLFSLFLVIVGIGIHWDVFQNHLRPTFRSEITVFEDGFLRVLAHCNTRGSTDPQRYRLRFLWGLALSQLRRSDYLFPGRVRYPTLTQPNFTSEMFTASLQLQKPSLGVEIDSRLVLHAAVRGVNPGWWGMCWLVVEGMGTLYGFFNTMLSSQQDDCCDYNLLSEMESNLELMRHYLAELGDLSKSFIVRNAVRPKLQCSNPVVAVPGGRT